LKVSGALQDKNFGEAIIAEHISGLANGEDGGFCSKANTYAFESGDEPMQKYVVSAFLCNPDIEWLDDLMDRLPTAFVRSLCKASLCAIKEKLTHEALLKMYTAENYELQRT
jgi:hypothetical protein